MKNSTNLRKLIYIAIPVVVLILLFFMFSNRSASNSTYSDVIYQFENQNVKSFTVNDGTGAIDMQLIKPVDKSKVMSYKLASTSLFIEKVDQYIDQYNKDHSEPMKYDISRAADNTLLMQVLPTLFMIAIAIFIWVFVLRRIGGMGSKEMQFGKAKFKNENDEKNKTTFDDVAGADEEKEELEEIVEFLKNPEHFTALGARIPKGVLLVGPPGTGKTLLAKAVSGEAGVPFFSISGSDFVEMFVGVGASRVRDLFQTAKKNSPCIIFIDEIDAVGRQRGSGIGGGHDEREQTLNQLLVEMDGFGANDGVILIAATNRPDVLDPALMRPGRFDRQVVVSYPDVIGREAILKVHARKKPLAPDVNLKDIAKSTAGFTGADLANLLNEAALLAARKDLKAITMEQIEEATLKVVVGSEKKSKVMSEREKKLTAYHETGHAIAHFVLETQDPVHQISIVPRGLAGGFTMALPAEDKSYKSKQEMLESLIVLLGGRVAEALIMGDISTGASNDIERATETAKKMVTKYGMSEKLGPILYGGGDQEVFIGRDMGHVKDYSEKTASAIDDEIYEMITNAYRKTEQILNDNMDKLHEVAHYLIKHEKMSGEDFDAMMNGTFVYPTEDESEE